MSFLSSLFRSVLYAAGIAATAFALFLVVTRYVSPWPGALLTRILFEHGAAITAGALEKQVPAGIVAQQGLHYDPQDPDAYLDLFRPADAGNRALPTIVWIHGGGFLSGHRGDISNYLTLWAGAGFAAVTIDYSLAPGAHYPTPVRQAAMALAYLAREGPRLGIDPDRLVLAGDSAGAQIAAQTANAYAVPGYANDMGLALPKFTGRLRGVVLYCGLYDTDSARLDGPFGLLNRIFFWSYSGTRDFRQDARFARMSVGKYVTGDFPPSFVSAGSADLLAPQSAAFAAALQQRGAQVETLFFPPDAWPALGHEYQFNMDIEAGRQALAASLAFARRVTATRPVE